jgi:Mg-chelatase subunit ChlD/DNA-binding beta-propeller fold protein YncE
MPTRTDRPHRVPLQSLTPALIGLVAVVLFAAGTGPPAAVPAAAQAAPRGWRQVETRLPSYAPDSMLAPGGLDDMPGGGFAVADAGRDRVVVIDGAGAVVRSFGVEGDGPTGLADPSDVAVDAARDRLYVVDRANRRLSVFTLGGTPVGHWRDAGPEYAFVPWAVASSPASGDVYVLSRLPWGRVDRFASDGRWLGGWGAVGSGPGQFYYPEDLAVHPDGRIVVADTNNNRLQLFTPDGTFLSAARDLWAVRSVDVDAATGQIYALVGGDGVAVLTPAGAPLREVRSDALADPFAPATAIAVGDAGRLAVSTGFGAADARQGVRQYDPAGVLAASTLADPRAHPGFFRPRALAAGDDGSLYALDTPVRVVRRYGADGAVVSRLDEASGDELTVAPGGDVFVVSTAPTGPVLLRQFAPSGRATWEKRCPCFSGMGLAADASRLYVTQALSHTVGVFQPGQVSDAPAATLTVPDAPYAWPLDVALGPDGRLFVAGGDTGRLDVFSAAGALVASWSTADLGGSERVTVAPDGTVFVLGFDGTVAAYGPDGSREARLSIAPVAGETVARAVDVAAGPGARLYVLEGHSHAILVYDPAPAGPASPTPDATPRSPCTVAGDKTALPEVVRLGDEVTVALSLDIRCPPGSQARADIVLVLDRSNSMAGSKLEDAKAAAAEFVAGLDLTRHRVAVVSFSDVVALDQALTDNAADIRAAIADVKAHGGTDIDAALDRAARHLAEAGRPGALGVVLLLTDGEPSGQGQPYVDPARGGARLRASGAQVYTIGLGANVDEALLVAVAGARERYFFAPTESELASIYRQLSVVVGGAVATDVQVVDEVGPDVTYVPASASGGAVESGGRITWSIGALPAGGVPPLTLRVRPRILGRLPTNTRAVAAYTVDGRRYTFTFPVPEVMVEPVPTATPTPTPTPTPRVTGPSTAYLPFAGTFRCDKNRRLPADILLIVDTSSSMRGNKMTEAVRAAQRFVGLVEPSRDRVGLISFDSTVRRMGLTTDLAAVTQALAALPTNEGTRIDLALSAAVAEFRDQGRPGVARVAVILTDGQPTSSTQESAEAQATLLRAGGAALYAIGLGGDADGDFLRRLADRPDQYYYAPGPADLAIIYDRIAVRLPCR